MRAAFHIYAEQKSTDLWWHGRFFLPKWKTILGVFFKIVLNVLFTYHIQSF